MDRIGFRIVVASDRFSFLVSKPRRDLYLSVPDILGKHASDLFSYSAYVRTVHGEGLLKVSFT